jgi:hypothetical protein
MFWSRPESVVLKPLIYWPKRCLGWSHLREGEVAEITDESERETRPAGRSMKWIDLMMIYSRTINFVPETYEKRRETPSKLSKLSIQS